MNQSLDTFARTRVKICGITNPEDALKAIALGADALGFILVPDTPRFVGESWTKLYAMLRSLPPFVLKVAVVKTCDPQNPPEWLHEFDALQFYEGNCAQDSVGTVRMIKAFRIRDVQSLDEIATDLQSTRYDALLLDTYHKDKLGGAGEIFNWDLAIEARRRFTSPLILAGGLTPENVGEAIRRVRPYAVDISSGVEAEPGRKDHTKLTAFFAAIRAEESLDVGRQAS